MIATNGREIVQTISFIEDEVKLFWLKIRSNRSAEQSVQLGEGRILRTGGIRDNENWMTPFLRKRVIV